MTFEVPAEAGATQAQVCGEFNDWSPTDTPMKRRKDGTLAVTVLLAAGSHRFRYLLDTGRWENDWAADDHVANEYGGRRLLCGGVNALSRGCPSRTAPRLPMPPCRL